MSDAERPNRPLVVRCTHDNTTRRITFPSAATCRLETINARIEEVFHLSALGFSLTYEDDDGEEFAVRTEADLTEAVLYFLSGEDEGASIRSGIPSAGKIDLRLEVVVEYDGPSLSDTSSLHSSMSGSRQNRSESSWNSSSYSSQYVTERAFEDDEVTELAGRVNLNDHSSRLASSELGSRWLREQSALVRRKAPTRAISNDSDREFDSDEDIGEINLVRDARGKLYYSYGSEGSQAGDRSSRIPLPPRPDIPVTGLAMEPGAPPVLAPDCSACGSRLDYMRYVCTSCGEGEMWKEHAPPRAAPPAASISDDSESTEWPVATGSGSSTVYRPRSQSIATSRSVEAVNGFSSDASPAEPDLPGDAGYELCPACIEEHGIAHAKAAHKLAKAERSQAGRRPRRIDQHTFREKFWGFEGWTDIEYNEDIECTICHTNISKNRFRCVSCAKFDLCRACHHRVREIHPAHAFLSLPDPKAPNRLPELFESSQPLRHLGVFCHNCLQDIVGPRFHCAVCPSWDLCIQCEGVSAVSGGHTADHIMMKIPVPIQAGEVQAVSRRARERWLQDSMTTSSRSASPSTVHAAEQVSAAEALDHGCRCRQCDQPILGKRFQCANCPSMPEPYNLCSICELRSYRYHDPLHAFFKFDRPVHVPLASPHPILPVLLRNRAGDMPAPEASRDPTAYLQHVLHRETLCDIHSDQIRGMWLRCAHCPAGFDICAEAETSTDHDPTHVFLVFKARVDMIKFRHVAGLGADRPKPLLQQAVYLS